MSNPPPDGLAPGVYRPGDYRPPHDPSDGRTKVLAFSYRSAAALCWRKRAIWSAGIRRLRSCGSRMRKSRPKTAAFGKIAASLRRMRNTSRTGRRPALSQQEKAPVGSRAPIRVCIEVRTARGWSSRCPVGVCCSAQKRHRCRDDVGLDGLTSRFTMGHSHC